MKILLAGGGTAGHIEPALAVARAWKQAHPEDELIFIGTASGLENTLVPAAGFVLVHIPRVSIPRSLSLSLLKVPGQLISSVRAVKKILADVDCAIGFGGYVSGPLYFAAAITRKPFVIHEQNARPGWANRIGAFFTPFTAVSYPVLRGRLSRAELTGLPLRNDVIVAIRKSSSDWAKARLDAKKSIEDRFGLDSSKPLLFIFGGSQGSQAINSVIESSRNDIEALGVSILHGVGKNNVLQEESDSYKPLSYIDEMADCYLAADILIARSGAVTCAEAAALARYSLFIPLPIGNGEQSLNAASLVAAGRAEVIEQSHFTSQWLIENLPALLEKTSVVSEVGSDAGVHSVDKITAIIERAAGVQ